MLKSINAFLYKPVFFSDITKKDGVIAICLLIVFTIYTGLETLLLDEKNLIRPLSGVLSFCILIILNRKKLHTIGFRKTKIKMTILVFIGFVIWSLLMNIAKINNREFTLYDFIFNITYFFMAVGVAEELIFRGYLWPRLVVLFGKHKGTIISGAWFGFIHVITVMYYGNTDYRVGLVINTMWNGVVFQYFMLLIYSFSENIFFPSTIHAAPHFFDVRRRLEEILNVLE